MRLDEKDIARHRLVYSLAKRLLGRWLRRKFAFSFKNEQSLPAPYILVANHNLDWDPLLLGLAFPHMYFVASEHLFMKGLVSKLLAYFVSPVPRLKGSVDFRTVLDVRGRLKKGCSVCIFPEGNRSFDGRTGSLHPTTGKFIKACRVPLVTYRLEGGFLTSPRWSHTLRKGSMKGRLVNVYPAERLEAMSPEDIEAAVKSDLYEDAYAAQSKRLVRYRGKRLAKGLETAIFMCPACDRIGRMKSTDSKLVCECGAAAEYDEYGYFKGAGLPFATFTQWYDWQCGRLRELAEADASLELSDREVELYSIDGAKKRQRLCLGTIAMTKHLLKICDGTKALLSCPLKEISDMSIYGRNTMVFSAKGRYYELKSKLEFNARKYLHLFQFVKSGS